MALGIDPTVDYAFKRLFGDPIHSRVLVHLLNAIFEGQFRVAGVEILSPFLEKDFENDKMSVLDLRIRDTERRIYNIEMQTTAPAELPNRLAYYLSSMYSSQLKERESYLTLAPAFCVCFLNRNMLPPTSSFHTRFRFCSLEERLVLTEQLEVHLVELPKYNGAMAELPRAQPKERWAYFLRHASEMSVTDIGRCFGEPEFEEAGGILDMISKTEEERVRYEMRTKAMRDHITNLEVLELARLEKEAAQREKEAARKEGLQEGRQEGLQEGRQEGRQEGLQEGQLIGRIQVLQELLGEAVSATDELKAWDADRMRSAAESLQNRLRTRS